MTYRFLFIAIFVLTACDGDDNDSDLKALQDRVAELETQLAALQTLVSSLPIQADLDAVNANVSDLDLQIHTLEGSIDDVTLQSTNNTARLNARDAVIQITDEGDIVFEGANVYVQNGLDSTYTTNGKGNLIIGYDEPRHECSGGSRAGSPCLDPGDSGSCPDGNCEPVADTQKTGSHNLVVGPGHRYPSHGGIVAGRTSTTSFQGAAVLGGTYNTASSYRSVVVGGSRNNASGSGSSILGGQNQTTSTFIETIPPIN